MILDFHTWRGQFIRQGRDWALDDLVPWADRAGLDVMIVESHRPHGPRNILVGTDLSPSSGVALRRGAMLARAEEATLHLLHTYRVPRSRIVASSSRDTAEAVQRAVEAKLEDDLRAFSEIMLDEPEDIASLGYVTAHQKLPPDRTETTPSYGRPLGAPSRPASVKFRFAPPLLRKGHIRRRQIDL